MIHSKKIYAAAALIAIVGLALSGCATSGPTKSESPTPKKVLTLSVGTAAALTNFSDIYVAESRGYFKQAGLKVNIQTGVGANGLNEVVSGQLDLLMFGVGQALLPVSSGQDTVIVYNPNRRRRGSGNRSQGRQPVPHTRGPRGQAGVSAWRRWLILRMGTILLEVLSKAWGRSLRPSAD